MNVTRFAACCAGDWMMPLIRARSDSQIMFFKTAANQFKPIGVGLCPGCKCIDQRCPQCRRCMIGQLAMRHGMRSDTRPLACSRGQIGQRFDILRRALPHLQRAKRERIALLQP